MKTGVIHCRQVGDRSSLIPSLSLDPGAQNPLQYGRERVVSRFAALVATVAATALAGVAAPCAMAARGLAMPVGVSGSVVAIWHGDPARGCRAAGVCNTSGSATYRPGFDGRLRVGRNSVSFGGAESSEPPVVRVRDGGPTAPIACADVLESFFSPLSFAYLGDELQVTLAGLELSAGRCGGPRTLDLAHALPRGVIKTARLRRAPGTIDLASRSRFVAGAFSGEVISTVKMALGRARVVKADFMPDVLRLPDAGGGKRRYWILDVQYRIGGVSGALVTDFHGLPDPACRALGACGTSGTSTYSLRGVSGRIDVLAGGRIRRGGRRPSARTALRRLRRGALAPYADSRLWHVRASVNQTATSPAGTCSDGLFTEPPVIDFRTTRSQVVLLLQSNDLGSLADTIRTRCPGPAQTDVLEEGSLAHGSIPLAAVGSRALPVAAGSNRTFARNGYTGSRHGELRLDLELVRSHVYTTGG
jgi:hypothetical protein